VVLNNCSFGDSGLLKITDEDGKIGSSQDKITEVIYLEDSKHPRAYKSFSFREYNEMGCLKSL